MTVRIAERVWAVWKREAAEHDEPTISLLFTPIGDAHEAAAAVTRALREVQRVFGAEPEASDRSESPFAGEWDWVRVSDGVLVQVVECELLEKMLPAVAAALERRGIEGVFDLYERRKLATPPTRAHLLECRVRLRGERLQRGPRDYLWRAAPAAHKEFLAVAERWCRQSSQDASCSLNSGTTGPVPLEPGEAVAERMYDTVVDNIHVELSAVTDDEFRSVAARAWAGGASLVVGGGAVEATGWPHALADLKAVLYEHADLFAYGHVRRGWGVTEALLDDSLPKDWPHRADHQPRGIGFTAQAFEDLYAPDAFGVQLLGAGYAGRLPDAEEWLEEPAANGAVLLEHADLPAWFAAPFVPFGHRPRPPNHVPPPSTLARAREALASILYRRGVLSRHGFADVAD
jgi:hypothetical protein